MKTPHKHAELIKAWADGAEIEFNDFSGRWAVNRDPSWSPDLKYRIKPEPKPDVVKFGRADCFHSQVCISRRSASYDNLILTFCGETGNLKTAGVL